MTFFWGVGSLLIPRKNLQHTYSTLVASILNSWTLSFRNTCTIVLHRWPYFLSQKQMAILKKALVKLQPIPAEEHYAAGKKEVLCSHPHISLWEKTRHRIVCIISSHLLFRNYVIYAHNI